MKNMTLSCNVCICLEIFYCTMALSLIFFGIISGPIVIGFVFLSAQYNRDNLYISYMCCNASNYLLWSMSKEFVVLKLYFFGCLLVLFGIYNLFSGEQDRLLVSFFTICMLLALHALGKMCQIAKNEQQGCRTKITD